MGKAAQNEQHKLLAAFYNNLAVAAGASGVLAPLFGLIAKYGDWSRTHKARDAIEAFNQAAIDTSATFNYTPYVAAAVLFVAITIPLARFTDWLILRDRRRRQAGSVA